MRRHSIFSRDPLTLRCALGLLLLLILIFVLPSSARADDEEPQAPASPPPRAEPIEDLGATTTEELPEIIVTAPTLTPRPVTESTAAVNAITRKVLDKMLPYSAADAFKWEPGLWSVQGASGKVGGTPVIRGFTGNQILMVLDGVRISNDRTPPGPYGHMEIIDIDLIDHIEVIRSPDSVLYGTQSVGGVAAFYTAWPVDYTACGWRVGGRTRLTASFGGDELFRWRLQGHVTSPRFRAVVGGTYTDADDITGGGDAGTFHPTAWDAESVDARAEYRLGRHDTLGASFFAIERNWEGHWLFPNRDQDAVRSRDIGILRWRSDRCTPFADAWEARLALIHFDYVVDRHDNDRRDEQEVYTPELDLVFHKTLPGGRHTLTYGLSAWRDIQDVTRRTPTTFVREIPEGYFQDLGVYLQDEWDATRRFRVTAGLRFDVANAYSDPDPATTDPLIDPNDIAIDQWDTAWTGKLGLLYKANSWLNLTANFSRGYRFPSLENLCGFLQHPDEISVGNPNTRPEYSWNAEVGVNVSTCRFHGGAAAYASWFDDLIIATYGEFKGMSWIDRNGNGMEDGDESIYLTSNAGTAEAYGFEVWADYLFARGWTVFGNLTIWDGNFKPDITEPLGMPNNATLGVHWQPCRRIWAEASAHMVDSFTKIPYDFYHTEAFFLRDPQDEASGSLRQNTRVPGYTTFDLRAGADISKNVHLTLALENLTDKKYRPYGARMDGSGRTFTASLLVDF